MSSGANSSARATGVNLAGLRFAVFSTRNLVFLIAVLAMNYTLMRPSPVDLLYILSFLITLFHLTLLEDQKVTRRTALFTLIIGAWAIFFLLASLPHIGEEFVIFELVAKTFAISIGMIGAFVSMSWNRRHFETFMRIYIVSCVIASILGTIGFVLQNELLTWDGRAKGLIDDPNMYGSFLIPAVVFCVYLLPRPRESKLLLLGALGVILLGILLSFSRIAAVAALFALLGFVFFQNRGRPRRLALIFGSLVVIGVLLVVIAGLISAEFTAMLMDRLTFAKAYDLGEEGRYARYLLVLPMIMQDPIGLGVLQLEKIFPEPIHNIWLSSFVNYGWGGGIAWLILAFGSVVVSIRNYRRTRSDITVALLFSLIGIVMCASLHEGEHWRHMWLTFGLVWGLNTLNLMPEARSGPTAPHPAGGQRATASGRRQGVRGAATVRRRPPAGKPAVAAAPRRLPRVGAGG